MERREFLQRGLVLAAAGAGSAVVGSRVAEAATTLYSDGFRRAKTTKGWGKSWYSPRYEMPWGISSHKGYFVMDPEGNADPLNPSPVLVLNKDVRDVDIIAKIYSRNKDARFGLVARYVNYGDFYACYVDRNHVRLSRFTMRGEQVLDKAQIPEQTDTGFMIRFHVSGGDKTTLKAKVWRAGRVQPRNWTVSKSHTDAALAKPAPYGCVFLHDADKKWTATFEISKFKATSSQTKKPTAPYPVFSYAGRFSTDQGLAPAWWRARRSRRRCVSSGALSRTSRTPTRTMHPATSSGPLSPRAGSRTCRPTRRSTGVRSQAQGPEDKRPARSTPFVLRPPQARRSHLRSGPAPTSMFPTPPSNGLQREGPTSSCISATLVMRPSGLARRCPARPVPTRTAGRACWHPRASRA